MKKLTVSICLSFNALMSNTSLECNCLDKNEMYFLKTSLLFELQDLYDKYIAVDVSSAKRIFADTTGQKNAVWFSQRRVSSLSNIFKYSKIFRYPRWYS